MKKWTLSESGRAAILLPLVLHCCGRESWYDKRFLRAVREHALPNHHLLEGCDSAVDGTIKLFDYVSRSISASGSFAAKLTASEVQQLELRSCQAIHLLIDCIELSKTYKRESKARSRSRPARQKPPGRRIKDNNVQVDFDSFHRSIAVALGQFLGEHDNEESDDNLENNDDIQDEEDDERSVMEVDSRSAPASQPEQPNNPPPTPQKGRKRLTPFQSYRALPNVHHGLHLSNNVLDGAHVMNFSVLPGEWFHGVLKLWRMDLALQTSWHTSSGRSTRGNQLFSRCLRALRWQMLKTVYLLYTTSARLSSIRYSQQLTTATKVRLREVKWRRAVMKMP
jgi:hypothetical protein